MCPSPIPHPLSTLTQIPAQRSSHLYVLSTKVDCTQKAPTRCSWVKPRRRQPKAYTRHFTVAEITVIRKANSHFAVPLRHDTYSQGKQKVQTCSRGISQRILSAKQLPTSKTMSYSWRVGNYAHYRMKHVLLNQLWSLTAEARTVVSTLCYRHFWKVFVSFCIVCRGRALIKLLNYAIAHPASTHHIATNPLQMKLSCRLRIAPCQLHALLEVFQISNQNHSSSMQWTTLLSAGNPKAQPTQTLEVGTRSQQEPAPQGQAEAIGHKREGWC